MLIRRRFPHFLHSSLTLPDQNSVLCRVQFCFPNPNKKKPAHPGDKSPERLASNSSIHFPLRGTSCVLRLASITTEAFSMVGVTCYKRTNITWERPSSRFYINSKSTLKCRINFKSGRNYSNIQRAREEMCPLNRLTNELPFRPSDRSRLLSRLFAHDSLRA